MNEFNENMGYASYEDSDAQAALTQKVVAYSFGIMLVALLVTAIAAFTTSLETMIVMASGGFLIICIAEVVVVLIANFAARRNHAILAGIMLTIYAYLTGMFLSVIFLFFTISSIWCTFVVCSALFGFMAFLGLTLKQDLTKFGNYLIAALVGIFLVSIINMVFLHSSSASLLISVLAILIFMGLAIFDVQKIKRRCEGASDNQALSLAVLGALDLYLDFINMFIRLLRIMGKAKRR